MSAQQSSRLMAALAGSASLFALVYAQPSVAQQAAQQAAQPEAAGGGGLEEIVVTARRKEEKAQTVPITLSTQTQASLEEMHFEVLRDLISHTPGLSQANQPDTSSFLFIRGAQNTPEYLNDAPVIFPPYPGYAIGFDLGSAQVLKGPQGTLFGLSAASGAVLFTTNPTTNDFSGRVEAEAGDYGHKHLEGVLNIPVVDDKLVVRVGAMYQHLNGFQLDVTSGVELGSQDYDIYRATITARPTDDFQNDFMIQYFWSDSVPEYSIPWFVNPNPVIPFLVVQKSNGPVTSYGPGILIANKTMLTMGRYAFFGGTFRPGGEYSSNQTYFMNDTARWDISDNLTLKNILAYEEIDPGPVNSAVTPAPALWYPLGATAQAQLNSHPLVAGSTVAQYTEELQIQGKALDDKLGFTAGTFNLIQGTRQPKQGPVYNAAASLAGGALSAGPLWGDRLTNGVFAQGTYDLGAVLEGLSITAGGRYTWDKEYVDVENFNGLGTLLSQKSATETSKKPSYLISIDYQMDPSTLIYFSDSKGSDRGGFGSPNTTLFTAPQFAVYGPETLNSYEVGVKSDWQAFGVKARTNVAAYYGDYSNVTSSLNLTAPSPVPGVPPSQVTATQNAATAHIEGFDADITLVPIDELTLNFGMNYTYFKFDKFLLPVTGQAPLDWSDAQQFYQPRITYTWTLTYKLPFLDWVAPGQDLGHTAFSVDYFWEAHQYGGTFFPQYDVNVIPGYGIMNMNVTWNDIMGSGGLDGRVYVQNLLENYFLTNSGSGYNTTGVTGVVPAAPRTWGFSISKKF